MSINKTNINMVWASLIIEELSRHGIDYFCISPGSRSTPLTAAVAYNDKAESRIHFDERGAAFHALGYARATGKPAVLICTSGTAVANYLPAVVEASMDRIPMILLTADRPKELRGTGANQTIIQPGIFSHYVNWEIDLICPNENQGPEFVLNTIDRAVSDALGDPPGPVHINCQFREPLAPGVEEQDFTGYLSGISQWLDTNQPFTENKPVTASPLPADIAQVATILNKAQNGWLIVGRLNNLKETRAVLDLSRKLAWPVFPDILSGLRMGTQNTDMENIEIIHYYDLLLHSEDLKKRFKPDTILHIGHQLTSKRLMQYLQDISYNNYIRVADFKYHEDPVQKVTLRIKSDIASFALKLSYNLTTKRNENLPLLRRASQTIDGNIYWNFLSSEKITQPALAYTISKMINANSSALFLASSLPIRDMDTFGASDGWLIPIGGNRGASGIDGTLASATGFAVGHKKPVTVYIGDLALLHDLNSLALVKDCPYPVNVVVVNNGGGNIFQRLPIAGHIDIFEKYFLTPHKYDFEKAAAMFDINYYHPETVQELINAFQRHGHNENSALIEIKIDPAQNKNDYDTLLKNITKRIDKISQSGDDVYKLGYTTGGDKNNPTVLFLHGFMGDKTDWRGDIVPYFEDDYFTVAIDLPGHGETAVNGPDILYNMSNTARAVLEHLEKQNIKKCHLAAYSMGGRLALYLLVYYPEIFDKAILESTSPGLKDPMEMLQRMKYDYDLAVQLKKNDFREFLENWYNQPLFAGIKKDRERFDQLFQRRLKNDPKELALSLQNMGTGIMPSLWVDLKNIKNKILFVAGENDAKYKKLAYEMDDLCERSDVCIIKDCGHNVHFEKPQEYIEQVKQFL